MGEISLHLGDITTDARADAIVNAANASLLVGGGVATAATRTALAAHPQVVEARFWLFGDGTYEAFAEHVR